MLEVVTPTPKSTDWIGYGADLRGASIDEALDYSGTNWTVHKEPVRRRGMRLEEQRFYIVRDSDDKPLSIVGSQYTEIQNREALEFLYTAVGRGDLELERVLPIRDGRRIIMVAKRPSEILIADEPIQPYQVFSTGHTGEFPFVMQSVAHRNFCMNIFQVRANKERGVYRIKHLKNKDIHFAEMIKGLEEANKHLYALKDLGDHLATVRISDREFNSYLAKLVPVPEPEWKDGRVVNQRTINNRQEARLDIAQIYYSEDNLDNLRGTAWGAFQAVVQYNDWSRTYRSSERRLETIVDGMNSNQFAVDWLLDHAPS